MTIIFVAMVTLVGILIGIAFGWATGWWHWITICYLLALALGLLGAYRYGQRNPS